MCTLGGGGHTGISRHPDRPLTFPDPTRVDVEADPACGAGCGLVLDAALLLCCMGCVMFAIAMSAEAEPAKGTPAPAVDEEEPAVNA